MTDYEKIEWVHSQISELKDGFEVVNGDRDTLHHLYGIDTRHIVEAALALKRG